MSDAELPWFKCNPTEWLASCSDMETEMFGYYARIILYMYQRGGYAPHDEGKLRHIWNCSRQRARSVRDALVSEGRIEIEGENLTQSRVKRELKIALRMRAEASRENETEEKSNENQTKIEEKSGKNPSDFSPQDIEIPRFEKTDTRYQNPDTRKEEEARERAAPPPDRRPDPEPGLVRPTQADLERVAQTYPEQGLTNAPVQAMMIQIGKAAIRLGSVDRLLEAMARYGDAVRRAKSIPVSLRRFLDPSEGFLDQYAPSPQESARLDPDALDDRLWRSYVGSHSRRSDWPRQLGPQPGQQGCRAPANIQREYGFEPVPFPAERGAA